MKFRMKFRIGNTRQGKKETMIQKTMIQKTMIQTTIPTSIQTMTQTMMPTAAAHSSTAACPFTKIAISETMILIMIMIMLIQTLRVLLQELLRELLRELLQVLLQRATPSTKTKSPKTIPFRPARLEAPTWIPTARRIIRPPPKNHTLVTP